MWFLFGPICFAERAIDSTVLKTVNEDNSERLFDIMNIEQATGNEDIQQNVTEELNIDYSSSSVGTSRESSNDSEQIDTARVFCFHLVREGLTGLNRVWNLTGVNRVWNVLWHNRSDQN